MAHLLLQWLNHDLQLSTVVTDIDRDFASGYLLGEVLYQLNHQHNFSDFMDSTIVDAKIVNFCLLEPSLRSMGVPLDVTAATAIMNGTKGAAASLLYQIKARVSTKSLERKAVLPLPNMPKKLAKPTYDAGNHAFFEHSIRRHVKSIAALKHEQDVSEDEVRKKQAHVRHQAAIAEQLDATKAERLHRAFIHSHFIKEAFEETDSPAWRVAIAKKNAREQRKAQFYQQLLAHRAKQKEEHTFSLRQTVQHDLDDFETRRGPGTKHSSKDSRLASLANTSTGYGLRSLSAELEKAENADTKSFLAPVSRQRSERPSDTVGDMVRDASTIKEQKQRREQRKQQLTRRRKRFVHECEHLHAHLGAARAQFALGALAVRETNSEQRVQRDIEHVFAYKEVARENRAARSTAYETQQHRDTAAAVERDASRYDTLVLRYDDDSETQFAQRQLLHAAAQAATRYAHEVLAASLTRAVVDFALVVAGEREDTLFARSAAVFLPEETWSEFKVQFTHGRALHAANASAANDSDAQLLSAHQLHTYLASFLPSTHDAESVASLATGTALSPWCPRDAKFVGAAELLADCVVLGEEVKYVRWMRATALATQDAVSVATIEDLDAEASMVKGTAPVDTAPPEPSTGATTEHDELESDEPLDTTTGVAEDTASNERPPPSADSAESAAPGTPPPSLLRVLVFGSPFAGKKTHAARLAERFDLALLSAHELLDAALQGESDIGVEAQELLQSGGEIPPQIYSRLVLDAVRAVEDTAAAAATLSRSDAPDTGGDAQPQRTPLRGWIVYDLPGTEAQGRDLEELLTGFVDPERVPSPFDHESLLAPGRTKPPLPPEFLHGKSGVDLVFALECSCEAAMERCLGQLEDAATHEVFHVVTNAPPRDATTRHRLTHANKSLTCSELVSIACVTAASSAQTQTRWFKRFATLREVATTYAHGDETHEHMVACVDAFFAQQREAAQRTQQSREARECGAMASEEHAQRRVFELECAISTARGEHARRQQTLQHAEEAKAKKEELAEHRQALDAAQKLVDTAVRCAADAVLDDHALAQRAREVHSGRLTPALSAVLATLWDDLESEYVAAMTQSFALQREQRRRTAVRAKRVVDDFCAFVRRPDAAQRHVDAFQSHFNAVVDEMRFDDATKLELHARADVLQDELAQLVDARAAENDDELCRVLADGWLEDTCQCVAVVFQAALQSECDRFVGSFQLLVDGYAAASSALAPLLEHVRAHAALLDVSCRLFFDASAVVEDALTPAAPTPAPAAVKGTAAAAKGKGKAAASTAAAAAAAAAPAKELDPMKEGTGDPMAADELLAAYDRALLKCDMIAQLVTAKLADAGTNSEQQQQAEPQRPTDVCTMNLLSGVRYEHALLQRRVAFLREAAQSASEHVARAMRSVELVLRDVVAERHAREQAAVAALVQYVRKAIEAEVDLPLFIDAKPELLYRFPITVQLREDTLVTVDPLQRLVAPAPVDPPPVLEPAHRVRLNARQRAALAQLLLHGVATSRSARALMPITAVVDTLASAASTTLLPRAWRGCQPHTLAKIASTFLASEAPCAGLVDVHALLAALSDDDALLAHVLAARGADADTDASPGVDEQMQQTLQ